MKKRNKHKFDLDFRPESYWDGSGGPNVNIKGEWRRRKIQDATTGGDVDEVPPVIFADSLPDWQRKYCGSIHPRFMGGEYLPDYLPGEIEIARVALESTTADVISIRARIRGTTILYRVADEYEWEYKLPITSSTEPLSLRDMIRLLDETEYQDTRGLIRQQWDFISGEGTPQEAVDFVSVFSEFYHQLALYYEEEAQKWLKQFYRLQEEKLEDYKRKWSEAATYCRKAVFSVPRRPLGGMVVEQVIKYALEYHKRYGVWPRGAHQVSRRNVRFPDA